MPLYYSDEVIDRLTEAIENEDIETVKVMVTNDVFLKDCLLDSDGYNILMFTAARGNLEIVKYLVKMGANPNAVAPGECPLISAIINDQSEVAEFLRPLTSDKVIKLFEEDVEL